MDTIATRRAALVKEALRVRRLGYSRAFRIRKAIAKSPASAGIGLLRPRHAGEVARRVAILATEKAERMAAKRHPNLTEEELDALFGIEERP